MNELEQDRARRADSNIVQLTTSLKKRAPLDAVQLMRDWDDALVVDCLRELEPVFAASLLALFPEQRRARLAALLPMQPFKHAGSSDKFPPGTVGRLMEEPAACFPQDTTVREAREQLRMLARKTVFTYAYCLDEDERLSGVVVMRDLMFADPEQRLADIMLANPFCFTPETSVADATQEVLARHYPVYPVCDKAGRLLGLVQGYALFEQHTVALASTPGRMVGVTNEERFNTGWKRSLKLRHPWLQLNLLTAFLAAAVVSLFEDTIGRIVLLAAFLPVLAGQSGNTGCQSMAVTLRAIALDEMAKGMERHALLKEAWLGLLNGALAGITAAIGMYLYAETEPGMQAGLLALVVFVAMTASCLISGMTGVIVPLALRRAGGRRPGDCIQHFSDHCNRCCQHGSAAWPRGLAGALRFCGLQARL